MQKTLKTSSEKRQMKMFFKVFCLHREMYALKGEIIN